MICESCEGRAQAFLCNACQRELAHMFESLARGHIMANGQFGPGWLENLTEAALGQTKMGEMVRHTRGEHPLRLNQRASRMLDRVHAALIRLVQQYGYGPDQNSRATTRLVTHGSSSVLAMWLVGQVPAIANTEQAGQVYLQVRQLVREIMKMVDRPLSQRFAGPCPTIVGHHQLCGVALMAHIEATEVVCPSCSVTHNIDELRARLLRQLDGWTFTKRELFLVMRTLNENVPSRTFYDWLAKGKLKPLAQRDGEPAYRLADVRQLRNSKTSKKIRKTA